MLILIPLMTGARARKHWLQEVKLAKNQIGELRRKFEAGLAEQQLRRFSTIADMERLVGRATGLREGMELYQYGLRYEKRSSAFRAAMKYTACNLGNKRKLKISEICNHLDKELRRIDNLKGNRANMCPPWGCKTWNDAFIEKRNDVNVLLGAAKAEGRSDKFALLMAWATWGEQAGDGTPVFGVVRRKRSSRSGLVKRTKAASTAG